MVYAMILISAYVVAMNFGYAALQIWLLQRRAHFPRWLGVAICVWAAAMSSLFICEALEPADWKLFMREHLYLPMAVEMVWNVLLLQVLVPSMILAAIIIRRRKVPPVEQPPDAPGLSRRRFLYMVGYGAAPAVALSMGVHGAMTRTDLRLRRFDIPLAGLPPELDGLTLAHVSDLHSGLFVGPDRLKVMTDLTNDLKADIVVVTGDLINRYMDEFPNALAAIQRLESRYGLFLCEGNHDTIPGPGLVLEACRQNNLAMLWNETATLTIRGRRLLLGGLPWMNPGPDVSHAIATQIFPARHEGDVRVLLAHHPHCFDFADGVDLLLSGHTHGGQIMVGDVGLGNLRFKYNSGRFHREGLTMIVNNGCGDWFPCRIGAPAEVGLLRLTRA
jgi:predicted MPP superfamily phosphohydrolase